MGNIYWEIREKKQFETDLSTVKPYTVRTLTEFITIDHEKCSKL